MAQTLEDDRCDDEALDEILADKLAKVIYARTQLVQADAEDLAYDLLRIVREGEA